MHLEKVILFVSDGRPTDRDTADASKDAILRVISEENARLNNAVIIQTFGIGEGIAFTMPVLHGNRCKVTFMSNK